MFRKPRVEYDSDAATKPYRDLLENLAEIYPVIRQSSEALRYWVGRPPLDFYYRVSDIKRAAEAARVADNKKATEALLKEFRSGTAPRGAERLSSSKGDQG